MHSCPPLFSRPHLSGLASLSLCPLSLLYLALFLRGVTALSVAAASMVLQRAPRTIVPGLSMKLLVFKQVGN